MQRAGEKLLRRREISQQAQLEHRRRLRIRGLLEEKTRRGLMNSTNNPQGGKAFGVLKAQQEELLESLNKEFLDDPKYKTDEDLAEKLEIFKKKYMEFDLNAEGNIDIMALKRMLEKLGTAKTHLELKKMISEVAGGMSETISYRDFARMMLGKRSAILKIILMYEEKAKEKDVKPTGPPPKKIIADLP